ncbi:hypothetical protein PoB_000990700 [Plakobranchus ocellatus]|uniref:Uncharacterized protein n=1 Tax=Plakobranchus ocellatus TaxID=259542 RepID=A0AAV3YKI1_9GAST|nr:hypothetical protein PoB_000990700 [Plakobranchus ocellatus]
MAAAYPSDGENTANQQNINQNESFTSKGKEADLDLDLGLSSSAVVPHHDQVICLSSLGPDNIDQIPMEVSELKDRPDLPVQADSEFQVSVPVIQITPAADKENCEDISLEDLHTIDSDQSANESTSLTMDYLRPPTIDTTINIARPKFEDNLNASRVIENANDADVEVICRYSSTPVVSPDRSGRNVLDSDVSMLSISSTSPIAAADISTPNKTDNDCTSSTQNVSGEKKMVLNLIPQKQENVLLTESYAMPQHQEVRDSVCRAPAMSHISQASFGDCAGGSEKNSYPCSDSLSAACYSATHNASYYPCLQSAAGYSDYHLARGASWTDLAYRSDLSPGTPPLASMTDPCCFALSGGMPGTSSCMGGISPEAEYFVYPSIYVSSAGLISVLLRNDISVEMTVDRTIRVVSHNHMMAVATDSRGTAACLYHPAVKVFQMGNTTDIATQNFRAQMGGNDCIVFSNGMNYFRLEGAELQPTAPMKFIDILRDQSVNLLFSSEGYGETLVASCMQVAAQAEYANLPKGGVIVRINGVKVTQTGGGDVTVVTGAKFIRLSPNSGTTRLGNRFVDIEVEKDWSVKLTRGSHSFVYAKKRAMVCNGKMEAGFDENNSIKVNNLAPRHPLLAEPTMVRRPVRKPVRPVPIPPSNVCCTPKRRPAPPPGFGGRWGAGGVGSI